MQSINLCIGAFVVFMVLGCGYEKSQLNKVLGANDLSLVRHGDNSLPKELQLSLMAIGKISNGCTGGHLGSGLVITAGHCFGRMTTERTAPDKACDEIHVDWGPNQYLRSKCRLIKFLEYHRDSDLAIIHVSPSPPYILNLLELDRQQFPRQIAIFSFPKRTENLFWSKRCDARFSGNPSGRKRLLYTCDTVSGSSGAPLIDYISGQLLGVHNGAGNFFEFWNYGTPIKRDEIQFLFSESLLAQFLRSQ